MRLILGVSGASGAVYSREILRAVGRLEGESFLVVSPSAIRVYNQEMERQIASPEDYLKDALDGIAPAHTFRIADHADIGAKPASGSARFDGMIVCPCSMKTLAGIAHGYTTNLIERAAEVCLKERRRLVVVPRETPYSLVQLRNMTALTEAGGIVLPASPGLYQKPKTLDDLGRFIAGRALSLFGLDLGLFPPWEGEG